MDAQIRNLERLAAVGDGESQAKLVREYARMGGDGESQAKLVREYARMGGIEPWECWTCGDPQGYEPYTYSWPCSGCKGSGYRPIEERFRLASFLGYEFAELLVGKFKPPCPVCAAQHKGVSCWACLDSPGEICIPEQGDRLNLEAWLWGINYWGKKAVIRAGVAAGRVINWPWEQGITYLGIWASQEWLRGAKTEEECMQIYQSLDPNSRRPGGGTCYAAGSLSDRGYTGWIGNTECDLERTVEMVGFAKVKQAICSDLTAWAMGWKKDVDSGCGAEYRMKH